MRTSEAFAELASNLGIGKAPATIVLIILHPCSTEMLSNIVRAVMSRDLAAQPDIEAAHWKRYLNNVRKLVLSRDCFTFAADYR